VLQVSIILDMSKLIETRVDGEFFALAESCLKNADNKVEVSNKEAEVEGYSFRGLRSLFYPNSPFNTKVEEE
jgi:hypothetical protein